MALIKYWFILVAIMIYTLPVAAQESGTEAPADASARTTVAPLPILFYSPETKTGFGAALNVFRRPAGAAEDARPSMLTPLLIYTVKNQVVSALSGSHYWDDEKNNLSGSLSYSNFPDQFYGLGNDTSTDYDEDYTTETYGFGVEYLRLLRPKLRAGVASMAGHAKVLEREPDGLLSSGDIRGTDGGWVTGLGVSLDYDGRDNITYPRRGNWSTLSFQGYGSALGSDYDFRLTSIHSRHYLSLDAKTVVAMRGLVSHVDGGAPFQLLPALGGDSLLRGHFGGRFRDRDLVALEAEIRRPVWRRLGLALFVGAGQVAPNPADLALDGFHAAGGFGLRYLFLSSENLNIRFDLGWSEDESGSYISLGEAF